MLRKNTKNSEQVKMEFSSLSGEPYPVFVSPGSNGFFSPTKSSSSDEGKMSSPSDSQYPSGVTPLNCQPSSGGCGVRKKPKRRRIITPEQRTAANIRERKRMFSMNDGFDELRKHLPRFSYENKLSRIETLRLAIIYIQYMTDIVKNNKNPSDASIRSLKHGWPTSKPRFPQFPFYHHAHSAAQMYPAGCSLATATGQVIPDFEYFGGPHSNPAAGMMPVEFHQPGAPSSHLVFSPNLHPYPGTAPPTYW